MTTPQHRVQAALRALAEGRPVLVTDDEERENEGDVILAAQVATPQWMAWTIRHTSGYLCAPLTDEIADRLDLPLMVARNQDSLRTAYTVSVDAATGVTTGISAADRTTTVQRLADPNACAADLIRPGHVLPLRARPGGVLERRGHTEAAVDLCRLAGLAAVGVIGELVHDDGSMMRRPAVIELGARHDLPVLTIADLVTYRQVHDRVDHVVTTELPTRHGTFTLHGFADRLTGVEHLALVSPSGLGDTPRVRVHSECLTGDALGSQRCDCGEQLQTAMSQVARDGGAILYLRGHEGRGVGLLDKLRAYAEQDRGLDTVDAQLVLGLPVDAREYAAAAGILAWLERTRIRLLTNNPAKVSALIGHGLDIAQVVPSTIPATADSARYLQTKRDRMGHRLDPLPAARTSRTTNDTNEIHQESA